MAYKKNSSEAFTGGSGQMVVMGELLHRKCNAAIPLIDVGTDVFAFQDNREEVARIQVKTATGKNYKKTKGYIADFRIPIDQLKRTDSPALFYGRPAERRLGKRYCHWSRQATRIKGGRMRLGNREQEDQKARLEIVCAVSPQEERGAEYRGRTRTESQVRRYRPDRIP